MESVKQRGTVMELHVSKDVTYRQDFSNSFINTYGQGIPPYFSLPLNLLIPFRGIPKQKFMTKDNHIKYQSGVYSHWIKC